MTHFKLQKPWFSEDKSLKNSKTANIVLLFSTISVIDGKKGKWNKADHLRYNIYYG